MRHLAVAWCVVVAAGIAVADEAPGMLSAVTIQQAADGVTIRLDLSAPVAPKAGELANPYRVYYDLPGIVLRGSVAGTKTVGHPLLAAVRVGQFSQEPPIARIVLDLRGRPGVKLASADGGRVIFIGVGAGGGRPGEPAPVAATATVRSATWQTQGADDVTYVLGLTGPARADSFYLSAPDRVVVDVQGATLAAEPAAPSTENGLVGGVRLSQYEEGVVRCVFDLKLSAAHLVAVRRNPDRVEIRLTHGTTRGRLVVVDAGHGGHDPGCAGAGGCKEKTVTLAVAKRTRDALAARGMDVRMTRDDDTFIPLYDRPAIANNLNADCFVSIHCNAMPESKRGQRSGTEVYYFTPFSELLASIMLREVSRQIGLEARGTYTRSFVVIRESRMPSVLVELGYLDHAGDGAKLQQPDFQAKCAVGIANGVARFLERQPPRQSPAASEPADPEAPGATPVTPLLGGRS